MKLTAYAKTIFCLALLGWASLAPRATAQSFEWVFVAVSTPRQTVVVQTPSETYTANFENVALVYPSGRARGLLVLSRPDSASGSNRGFGPWEVYAGRVQFRDGAVTAVLLRARETDTRPDPGDEITIILRPEPVLPQDCLIYDFVGPPVHARFEAHGRIAVFRD